MDNFRQVLRDLDQALAESSAKEAKIDKLRAYAFARGPDPLLPAMLWPFGNDPSANPAAKLDQERAELMDILKRHDLETDYAKLVVQEGVLRFDEKDPRNIPPLDHVPCANHNPNIGQVCRNPGSKHCSACMLVSYCSASCQKTNWPLHKSDCKTEFRSDKWRPAWIRENRTPAFVTDQPPDGMGCILWGNMPAIDIINVANNEGLDDARNRDFSLAFAASGDLRNVIQTVNGLPEDYKGHLSICINDNNSILVVRNLIMISLLGLLSNENEAAEYSLHICYSLFLPQSYIENAFPHIIEAFLQFIAPGTHTIQIGQASTLKAMIQKATAKTFTDFLADGPTPEIANNALGRLMMNPRRVDYCDRYFADLEPSHRRAVLEWRRFGILLPFGAPNAHMNTPNRWMFTPGGRLYLLDSANPLNGWDMETVVASGKRHGATRADIMGCLFFHVKDQLVEFARRIRRFRVDISVSDFDARDLATHIKSKSIDLGPFDRIEVSNIVDKDYVGLQGVLATWGPLLNPLNKYSTLIGLLMNWVAHHPQAKAQHLPPSKISNLILEIEKYQPEFNLDYQDDPLLFSLISKLDAVYENSGKFKEYLTTVRAAEIAKSAGVCMRTLNSIVPSRPGVPLGKPMDALPEFKTKEKWYYSTSLGNMQTTERYVEWTRA